MAVASLHRPSLDTLNRGMDCYLGVLGTDLGKTRCPTRVLPARRTAWDLATMDPDALDHSTES